jgi:SAM-dependent methyltransferase
MNNALSRFTAVKAHYEKYVYPDFPRLSSVRGCDTYALNLEALWAHFNGERLDPGAGKILLAGSGSFSPYPTAVANPRARITALDFSKANLHRARQHTWLHLYFNVDFVEGDLLKATDQLGEKVFHFIDCYGVLHHIREAAAAWQTLHALLKPGGFARIMVYSRGARRSIQAVRWAMKLLHIQNVREIKALYRRAKAGSRFRECLDSTPEATFDAGLADLFLHPYAKTYTVDELLGMLDRANLEPLQFIHPGALLEVNAEIARLRAVELDDDLTTHFILLAGRREDAPLRQHWETVKASGKTVISLNPVIQKFMPMLPMIPLQPAPKLGFENPVIDLPGKRLLSRFKKPVPTAQIDVSQREAVAKYRQALFLIETAK